LRNDEFERLYEENAADLLAFLAYRVGDRATAEDILADAFERALRARRRFDPRRGSQKAWLYSIALNRARDVMRSRQAETRALTRIGSESFADDPRLTAVEHSDEVMGALAQLSDEEREAVALRFGADLTVPEIARVLREPLTTIEGRVYRALRKLRGILG
jgi:RNA polymerase sigma factor (sigma-70 family)